MMLLLRGRFFAFFTALAVTLTSCMVGPDYNAPTYQLETSFKNAGFTAPPPQGSWWKLFNDKELDRLINRAESASPAAAAALARFNAARAELGLGRVDLYPAVTGDGYARRRADSQNTNFNAGTYDDYRAALNLDWEIDLWGRVRRQVNAAEAEFQAAGYDYEGAILSLRGELTRAYLSLRFADAEIALLEDTAALRAEARRLMKKRFDGGASSRLDYQRAVTEHESVKAELIQLRAERARFENAVAALTGQSASGFRLPPTGRSPRIPTPPTAAPSDLLRRRPDLAAAERRLAAASETIGVVVASTLPKFSIGAEGGLGALRSSDLFDSNSLLWSLGPEVELPVFQGGSLLANKERAIQLYHEALALYRDTLLQAVRETEDSFGDAGQLAQAAQARRQGSEAAGKVAELTRKRYVGGVTDYFEVVDAERTALAEQRALLSVELARALATTRLIQALGGGWSR